MRYMFSFLLFLFVINKIAVAEVDDGKFLLNHSISVPDSDGYYRLSNYEYKCLQQLIVCSKTGWSLKFKLRLNSSNTFLRKAKYLLFSTGAHESHTDGIAVYLHQSKHLSYLEFGIKEFNDDQYANYWNIFVDFENNKWVSIVLTVGAYQDPTSERHQMSVFIDGYLYQQTQIESPEEIVTFTYSNIHSKTIVVYGLDSGIVKFDDMVYYERILNNDEISNTVSLNAISMGCINDVLPIEKNVIGKVVSNWQQCRNECYHTKSKIAFYSHSKKQCACQQNVSVFDNSLNKCSMSEEWIILTVSNAIDLNDAEVGLEIHLNEKTVSNNARLKIQQNEALRLLVSIRNERNLASLTLYGDIEEDDLTKSDSQSNEIYAIPGIIELSWQSEGMKKVHFRADYYRMVNSEMAEYITVYIDVFHVKISLPIKFVYLTPNTQNGLHNQNFTVQTFGSLPINCTIDFGNGHRQSNITKYQQYYTADFSWNYTRYGQYNVSARCFNKINSYTTNITRTVRRRKMNQKMIIYKDLAQAPEARRFYLKTNEDFSFRNTDCLHLRNPITNETMDLIWRKTTLEIIPIKSLPIGNYFYQLECDSVPLQSYLINVQPAVYSLELEASKTSIKAGQSVQFFITLEPTVDLTVLFDCGTAKNSLKIVYIAQINDVSPISIGNCTYSSPGEYNPIVYVMNHISSFNQTMVIDVEAPTSSLNVEVQDQNDTSKMTLIKISSLDRLPFQGTLQITILDNLNETSQTIDQHVQLTESSDFAINLLLNITTYGRQILQITKQDPPQIDPIETVFTIGTDIIGNPQVYLLNQIGSVNKDLIWIDIQWTNGIGFDIKIDYGNIKRFILFYEQFQINSYNKTLKKNEGIHQFEWKMISKQHLQIGYKFPRSGTYKINVTFLQPSSKLLRSQLKCSTVVITKDQTNPNETCFTQDNFSLKSSYSIDSTSMTHLPYGRQYDIQAKLSTGCSTNDFLYSYYLISMDHGTFLEKYCSNFHAKLNLTIESKSLSYGFYKLIFTITRNSNLADHRQYIQPMEIVYSDLKTEFDGYKNIKKRGEKILLNFYSNTNDPNDVDFDRRQLNFTLICYRESLQPVIFEPNQIEFGSTRPTKDNPTNLNPWSIKWNNLQQVFYKREINLAFYEKQCFISNNHSKTNQQIVEFDVNTNELCVNESDLMLNNNVLNFILIIRHLHDNRQLIERLKVDKDIETSLDTSDLNVLEDAMNNLNNLAFSNPSKAIDLISIIADRLNQMSVDSDAEQANETETDAMTARMTNMRSKMLSSVNTVLDSADDTNMIDKTLRASSTVTANSNQMPLDNQEKGANIIGKVGEKVKNMEIENDDTVSNLATLLMDVGSNVLQAASKTVGKDKNKDPIGIIKNLEADIKKTEDEETDTKVLYAPSEFYDACDECDTLPEDRWNQYREQLEKQKKAIVEGRERAADIAKQSSGGLFTVGDVLANRSSANETQTIESKTMAMTVTKSSPDGKSSLSAGDANIRLPNLFDLNSDSNTTNVLTKILESKTNPFASANDNSSVEGSVVTVILSQTDGSEISVQNTTKPISIFLTRPENKRGTTEEHQLNGTSFQYHRVTLFDSQMALSVYISTNSSSLDLYSIYVLFNRNETKYETPDENHFDFLFVIPKQNSSLTDLNETFNDEYELTHTIFMPPTVHFGNGTYVFGVKLLYQNLTDYQSNYNITIYASKCQYWNEKNFSWSSEGCQVGTLTTLKATECLCTHLTTFGTDFYVPPNTIDFKTVFKKFKKLHENAAVFSTVVVIYILYIIVAIWARRKDHQDLAKWTAKPLIDNIPIDTYYYLLTVHTGVGKESGTTSNIHFVLSGEVTDSGVRRLADTEFTEFPSGSVRNFVMSVEKPLDSLLYLRIWHDNSGRKSNASWFLNMINVLDLQTGEKNYFICNDWLAVEKGDGQIDRVIPIASSKELNQFTHLFTQSIKKKFSDGHLWFSVFSRPVRSNFTRLQRISCCISLLFCTMISNAMFFRQETNATEKKSGVLMKIGPIQFTLTQMWISFIGLMIVLPINLIIVTLFRKAKYNQKTLITNQQKADRNQKKSFRRTEQHEKTKRFFSQNKYRSKYTKCDEEDVEHVGALSSVEDTIRTFPHWTVYIGWSLVILSMLTCSFFVILYSLEWGKQKANEWLITIMLSFGQSTLLIDPFKVLCITAIISLLIRRPYEDETLSFDDPFTGVLLSNNSLSKRKANDTLYDANIKKILRQRRVNLFNLRPIDSTEMARVREKRLNEIKFQKFIRESLIYVIYTIVLLFLSYQSRDTNSYSLYKDTKSLFINDEFYEVNSILSWWDYCENTLLKGLYANSWYNNKNLTWREKLTTASRVSMRVGAPRIRQLRIKDNSCRIHRRLRHLIHHCRDDYNWFDDDTKDYAVRWEYVLDRVQPTSQTKQCKTPWCHQSSMRTMSGPLSGIYTMYKDGGYVVSLGRTYEKAFRVLDELRSDNWLDQFTRAIIIEFSLYNANVNLFVAVTLSFEMNSIGSVIQDHKIKVFRLYDHVGNYGLIVYAFEFLFVLFTIHSLVHEVRLIFKYRREYFRKFWNFISFLIVIFSITAIIMYGIKKTMTRLAIRSLRKTEMDEFVNFNVIGRFDEIYAYLVALVTFFTMLKFLKLLRFHNRINMLTLSLNYAANDLISFGFVFAIFMFAYAQFGFAIFGYSLEDYKSFATAWTTCFRMLLGEIKAPVMVSVDIFYGTFYFVSFVTIVFIALLSIFITILNDSFARVKRDLAEKQQENHIMNGMWSIIQSYMKKNRHTLSENDGENTKIFSHHVADACPLARCNSVEL